MAAEVQNNEVSCSGEAWAGIRAGPASLEFLVSRVVVLSPLILQPASQDTWVRLVKTVKPGVHM